jgi:hypothetical protein
MQFAGAVLQGAYPRRVRNRSPVAGDPGGQLPVRVFDPVPFAYSQTLPTAGGLRLQEGKGESLNPVLWTVVLGKAD